MGSVCFLIFMMAAVAAVAVKVVLADRNPPGRRARSTSRYRRRASCRKPRRTGSLWRRTLG